MLKDSKSLKSRLVPDDAKLKNAPQLIDSTIMVAVAMIVDVEVIGVTTSVVVIVATVVNIEVLTVVEKTTTVEELTTVITCPSTGQLQY